MSHKGKFIKLLIHAIYIGLSCYLTLEFALVIAKNKDRQITKYKRYFEMMCKWNGLDEKNIGKYFEMRGYSTIGIYGGGKVARLFYNQMKNESVKVKFVVDRNSYANSFSDLPLYKPEEQFPKVDVVVIVPFYEMEEIVNRCTLRNSNMHFISLEDVIYETSNE